MTERALLVFFVVLNLAMVALNMYIGGWNLLAAAFSYAVALYCSYVLGRIS